MKRVHRMIRHSSEMDFFDSGGHMDRENTRVFLLLTHSAAGGLPIGVLLLSNEQNETISCALRLYLSLLDDECLTGRGKKGWTSIFCEVTLDWNCLIWLKISHYLISPIWTSIIHTFMNPWILLFHVFSRSFECLLYPNGMWSHLFNLSTIYMALLAVQAGLRTRHITTVAIMTACSNATHLANLHAIIFLYLM